MIQHRSVSLSLCRRLLFGVALCAQLLLNCVAVTVALASEPPTPSELGKTPPPFPVPVVGTNEAGGIILGGLSVSNPPPPVIYVTNTVYIIPSNTIIRIQVRDQLDSGDWFEPVVFKSRTDYKFFRVLFETGRL
jgi:hypothetical protein